MDRWRRRKRGRERRRSSELQIGEFDWGGMRTIVDFRLSMELHAMVVLTNGLRRWSTRRHEAQSAVKVLVEAPGVGVEDPTTSTTSPCFLWCLTVQLGSFNFFFCLGKWM